MLIFHHATDVRVDPVPTPAPKVRVQFDDVVVVFLTQSDAQDLAAALLATSVVMGTVTEEHDDG